MDATYQRSASDGPEGVVAMERRQWHRFASAQAQVTLRTGSVMRMAGVFDTSAGGIGLLVRDVRGLHVGQHVMLESTVARAPAVVEWIIAAEQLGWRVGLAWTD